MSNIHVDPQIPASIKMTGIHAGGPNGNTIPDRAEFTLDLRAQTNDVMNQLEYKLTQMIEGISMIYDAEINLHSEIKLAAAEGRSYCPTNHGECHSRSYWSRILRPSCCDIGR